MRFLNLVVVFLIAFSLSGIALYAVGPNLSTQAVAERAFNELEKSGKMDEMVRQFEEDPDFGQYLQRFEEQQNAVEAEGETGFVLEEEPEISGEQAPRISQEATEEPLAFETKEDAASVMIKKVGFRNLLKMKNAVENDAMTADEVIAELDEDLSEEEMLALKVLVFKEWQSRNQP